jgi:6-phosphogluconolactonase
VREAADELVRCARLSRGRPFSLAIAGGSTLRPLYRRLAHEPYRSRLPWARIHIFWTDERCVSPEHAESNFGAAWRALLSRVPIPPANIHRIPVGHPHPDLAYERVLRRFFRHGRPPLPRFDLLILGLGVDGHAASLFPNDPALDVDDRWVTTAAGGTPPLPRITLTLPALTRARRILWLASGPTKASAVRRVLRGPGRLDGLPAQRIQPRRGSALWLVDRQAARLLA